MMGAIVVQTDAADGFPAEAFKKIHICLLDICSKTHSFFGPDIIGCSLHEQSARPAAIPFENRKPATPPPAVIVRVEAHCSDDAAVAVGTDMNSACIVFIPVGSLKQVLFLDENLPPNLKTLLKLSRIAYRFTDNIGHKYASVF